jgi:hypothetical protein
MKLTDHAKTLSLSLTVSDDSRLGEAFLVAMEALRKISSLYEGWDSTSDIQDMGDIMYEVGLDALAEIEAI